MAQFHLHTDDHASSTVPSLSIQLEHGGVDKLRMVMRIMGKAFSSLYGESWNEHQCRSMLSLPGTCLMIAYCEQQPCGFAITRNASDEEELLMIAVSPRYQKKGVGSVMLRRLIDDAVENDISAIFLEVRSNNPAQGLYQKLGFQKIGQRVNYYTGDNNEKFDAITYKKSL
ncbi:ribosomal protein S18-alanine N-acetyltransferase [Parasphingorhabdus sp.]|uniref:ribosomal protein S18-alanine N-acetyltransferase n=1 Tax=Parasphingorhabdus sp. TaxID=2709688 RepID=UPI003BAF4AB7